MIKSKSICIAYETVTDDNGRLPLLAPMSAVAGRMSVQAGAHSLEKNQKGRGLLLGGAPGVESANVVILGGGVVGENAALIATGMKANVFIIDKSTERLSQLKKIFGNKMSHLFFNEVIDYMNKKNIESWHILFPDNDLADDLKKNNFTKIIKL